MDFPKQLKPKNNVKAIRKTYTLTEDYPNLVKKIKDKLLNQKCVTTDTQLIRMELSVLELTTKLKLFELAQKIPTLLRKSKI